MIKKILFAVLLLSLVLCLFSCSKKDEEKTTATESTAVAEPGEVPYDEVEDPVSEYTVVYPTVMGTYVEKFTGEKYAAVLLQDMLSKHYGASVKAVNDSEAEKEKEIIIGNARSYEGTVEENSYCVERWGDDVYINADGIYAYMKAVDAFVESLDRGGLPAELKLTGVGELSEDTEKDFVYLDPAEDSEPPAEKAIKSLTIMGTDISKYKIIYHVWGDFRNPHYGLNEAYAAEQLQKYIKFATGIELPIETDESSPTDYEIVMGITNREGDVIEEIDRSGYGEETTLIKTEGKRLIITGAQRRGTIYATYTFLEEYLGVRFFTADCEIVYKSESIDIEGGTYDEHIPTMEFRDVYNKTMHENEYSSKRKVNSNNRRVMNYKQGGNFEYAGDFVHTMGTILDLDNAPGAGQPCFTDEATYQKALEKCLEYLSRKPNSKFISVTQNDVYHYCACGDCKKLINQEECEGGALIHFINRLAGDIKKEFPDVKVMTLAYMFSLKPPKTAPADNVIIMFCPIDSCCRCTLNDPECSTNRSYAEYYNGWLSLTDNVYVWYYVKECINNGMYPFMNFDSIYYNYRDFNESGVKGVFNEALSENYGGEFGAMRSYLLSLLMWDQNMTYEEYLTAMDEFIDAYYGEASEVVRAYLDLMDQMSEGRHFGQYASVSGLYRVADLSELTPVIDEWFNIMKGFEYSKDEFLDRIRLLERGYTAVKNGLN